jgi:NAD(P)-dependent dehydrogenase (short-subunit alcohol dehydrogenase family)
VASRDSIRAMVHQIDQRWGRLDILVNNAALFTILPRRESPWEIPSARSFTWLLPPVNSSRASPLR